MPNTAFHQLRRKILFEYLEKFPDAGSHTLARMLHRDQPLFFESHEKARTFVRIYRGLHGSQLRSDIQQKKYYRNAI
jgi:hypothetical protein